jgi:hypothetical protein
MAVNAPNPGIFLAQITQVVVNLRNDFNTIMWMNAYISAMGGTTFLTTAAPNGIGMSTGDAAVVIATLGNLAALAAVYNGGTQGATLNYSTNSQPLWGGN